ncbi:hypothetical protein PoB_004871600 [Plakobranchus ocellatus]|uniref:TTI1 N-terminal TPR domain-containing protein n=1 Tax=Plakobranchus ocellatus TaxID=259542 RepID=A0AAV4BFU8_9GAST|nr:hypothetical protein PoB_004871600 [Plakobranchus ocellatus]
MALSELDCRRHAALELLKPICISLMKDATKERVKALNNALHEVDDRIAQEIQQYILFPVQTRLQLKDLPETLLCELCEVVVTLFQKTAVASLSSFFEIFNPLMFTLTPKDGSPRVFLEFEETKTSLIKALMQLLKATQEIVLSKIYVADYVPALGQLVSVLLSFAELEKSRAVQRLALEGLLVVLQKDSKFGKKNEPQLADFFSFCLPGVTMATCRIATGDSKQGHSVIVIVTLVLQDTSIGRSELMQNQEKATASMEQKTQRSQKQTQARSTLSVERSDDWVKATASKVKVLVDRLCKLVSHDNWRVRLGLAELCEQLLTKCCRSLSESLPTILETLVGLINDPYGNVAKKAVSALQAFSTAQTGGDGSSGSGSRALVEILEENMYKLVTSLPRQIRMCDEEEKPALIRLLNGYISLLGPSISCIVNSTPHLNRLCLALVQSLELDVRDLRIVEERGGRPDLGLFLFLNHINLSILLFTKKKRAFDF